jgi:SET domain-containing protein
MNYKFIISRSDIEGRGCFATKPINAGELICVMQGDPLTIPQLREQYRNREEAISDPLQIGNIEYLDLYEPYVFFNHSCEPNSAIIKQHQLVAVKDIQKGDEVTFDYSATEWTDPSFSEWTDPNDPNYRKWEIVCKCGSPSCRKLIDDFGTLPTQLQVIYVKNGWVQDFIINRYYNSKPDSYKYR